MSPTLAKYRRETDPIRGGDLRQRITIEEPSHTVISGVETTTWTEVVADWPANVIPRGVFERRAGLQVQGEVTHVVECYPKSADGTGFDETMRIVYGTRYLQIVGVRDVGEAHRKLLIECVETSGGAAYQGGS